MTVVRDSQMKKKPASALAMVTDNTTPAPTVPRHLDPALDEFDLFSSLFYLMAHADFHYHDDLDKVINRVGLSRTQYRMMTVLSMHSPLNVGDLADHALLKRSTCSHALVAMRRNGWVDTCTHPEDHRIIEVALTAEGRALVRHVMKSASKQLHRAVSGLDEKDISQLVDTLQVIVSNLSRLPIE
jgi:MarR family transcriptional regulator, organic hydroperoxide resistance regulator